MQYNKGLGHGELTGSGRETSTHDILWFKSGQARSRGEKKRETTAKAQSSKKSEAKTECTDLMPLSQDRQICVRAMTVNHCKPCVNQFGSN